MPETYSITIAFDSAGAMAKWLEGHAYPTHSNVNVSPTTGEVGGSASANASDPWADESDNDTPWPNGPDPAQSQPANSGPVTRTYETQKGQQKWTFGAGNAPMCGCNAPAAFQEGNTNGKPWKRWTCAKAAPDGSDAWKNKCDFSEFVGGRGKK